MLCQLMYTHIIFHLITLFLEGPQKYGNQYQEGKIGSERSLFQTTQVVHLTA